jgi:hypothetical protein
MEDLGSVIINDYIKWIKDNTFIKKLDGEEVKIISPFLDSHNDYINLYAKRITEDTIRLSDGGILFFDLESYGIKLTEKKKELFDRTLESYSIRFDADSKEIYVVAENASVGKAKHRLIQCLLAINDFFNYTERNISELFFYEVYNAFLESNVQFTPEITISGKSGYQHRFEFAIGITKNKPQRLISLIPNPNRKQRAEACIFAFLDLQRTERKFTGAVIYKGKASDNFINAFKNYDFKVYSWEDEKEGVISLVSN